MLDLPYPPTVNSSHLKVRGRVFRHPKTVAYMQEVAWLLKGIPLVPGVVKMTLIIHPPDKRRRDSSNILKILEDAIVKGGWIEDDHLIHRHEIEKSHVVPGGQVLVRIEPYMSKLIDNTTNTHS